MTAISQITTYEENCYQVINDYLENAYVELTFLGKRSVRAVGYEGSICLDEVARKITILYDSNQNINQKELDLGLKIRKKIFFLERVRNDLDKKTNLITRIFIYIRDSIYLLFHSFDPNPYADLVHLF